MAVRSVDELLTGLRSLGVDETKPEFISMLEDISDSYGNSSDLETARSHITRLEEELLAANQRYVDRFYSRPSEQEVTEAEVEVEVKKDDDEEVSDESLVEDMMEE